MLNNPVGRALRALSEAWEHQRLTAYTQLQVQGAISHAPDLSFEGARHRSAEAKVLLSTIEELISAPLPHDVGIALRQARYRLEGAAREADWYWTVIDPSGVGFFGMFAPSAYCGGFLLNFLLQSAASTRVDCPGDLDRYLAFVSDYARVVEQMTLRTAGQAERGMRIPLPQLPAARTIIDGFRGRSRRDLMALPERLVAAAHPQGVSFMADVRHRVETQVLPAFAAFAEVLSQDYAALAPEGVGMTQFADGLEVYRALVKRHTTTDHSPEEVHAMGLQRMESIQAAMRATRSEAGFAGDPAGYLTLASSDPRFSAGTTDAVAAVFQRYIDRLEPVFDKAFHRRAAATYGVAALPEALQGSMTFGYYDAPKAGNPVGLFMFNAANLVHQPLLNIGSLNYHELVPGHHLHLSLQQENQALHPVGRYAFCNAFNEAWAEYAATLAGELGMYETPEERYGRLMMDAFLTSRLVVDTGMNALDWSLDQARAYMRQHTSMAEVEVLTESLRYACDIPGQALAYKLGDMEMLRLRSSMERSLGERFDVRDFHDGVLSAGALPLPDLGWHLEHVAQQLGGLTADGPRDHGVPCIRDQDGAVEPGQLSVGSPHRIRK